MEMVLKGIIWTVFHLRQLRYISAITSIFGSENIFIKAFFTGFCLTSRELFSRLVEAEVRINKQTTTYLHECVYGIFLSAVDLDFLEEREVRFKPITRPDVFQAIHDLSSICSRLLVCKSITWKSQHRKATFVLSCSGKLLH